MMDNDAVNGCSGLLGVVMTLCAVYALWGIHALILTLGVMLTMNAARNS